MVNTETLKGFAVLHKGQPTVTNPAGNLAPSAVTVASLNMDKMMINTPMRPALL